MNRGVKSIFRTFVGYLALNVGTFLMLKLLVQYSALDDHVGFLQQKQAYLHLPVWKAAFYTHVFSSILTLFAGFTQFSDEFLRRHRRMHRFIGTIYACDILFINFPAGLIMAIYANGHLPSKIAFLILDSLWFWFTLKAIIEVRRGNISRHRDFMMRSYALTLSALTLRTWKIILTHTTDMSPELIYMMDAWLGFVPNWLFAEWLIYRKNRPSSTKKHADDGKHRDPEDRETNHEGQDGDRPCQTPSVLSQRDENLS